MNMGIVESGDHQPSMGINDTGLAFFNERTDFPDCADSNDAFASYGNRLSCRIVAVDGQHLSVDYHEIGFPVFAS